MSLEALKLKRMRLRNEISFRRGEVAHGGSHYDAEIKVLQKELRALDKEIEDCQANQ